MKDEVITGPGAHRREQRARDTASGQTIFVCNFGLILFFFSHVKMRALLVRWRAVYL
jgi:hypothetical protein